MVPVNFFRAGDPSSVFSGPFLAGAILTLTGGAAELVAQEYEKEVKIEICMFGIPIQQRHPKTPGGEQSC